MDIRIIGNSLNSAISRGITSCLRSSGPAVQCVITQLWPGISSTCMQWCLHVCTIYIHHQSIQNHINTMIYQLLEGLYPSLHEQAHHVFANTLTCLLIETLLSRDLCPTYRQLPPDAARYIKQTILEKTTHAVSAMEVLP